MYKFESNNFSIISDGESSWENDGESFNKGKVIYENANSRNKNIK